MTNVQDVHNEFALRLGSLGPVVVAGGAVRDQLMDREPKDFDIFVLQSTFVEDRIEAVKTALADLPVVHGLEWHRSEPYLIATVLWGGFEIQVMLNPAQTVDELLDTFDWNVCLFAYDGQIYARTGIDEIGEGKELKLQASRFHLSTLRRGFRFSERFKMQLPYATVLQLCQKIAEVRPVGAHEAALPDMPALAANALPDEAEV